MDIEVRPAPGPPTEAATPEATPVDVHALPKRTTPTWEMELLISGATVFALLQLSDALSRFHAWLHPRLDAFGEVFAFMVFIYCKTAVITLALTFVLHLALRAWWVALVALRSLYPEGIDWARHSGGPLQREVQQGLDLPFEERVERAEDRASLVFAVGLGFALAVVTPLLLVLPAAAVSLALSWLVELQADVLLPLSVMVLLLPLFLTSAIDRRWGSRLHRDGLLRRCLSVTLRVYARCALLRGGNYPLLLFGSRIGEGRLQWLTVLVLVPVIASILAATLYGRRGLGEFDYFPQPSQGGAELMRAVHYGDQRSAALRYVPVPFIAGAVNEGPYLELFIPYVPQRWNALLAEHCPEAASAAATDADWAQRHRQRIDCLVALLEPRLDGRPLPGRDFRFGEDARSGLPGLRGFIPVQDLAPGQHVLTVRKLPRADAADQPPAEWHIPFWR